MQEKKVKVCDAIMGSGKTEAAITYMNEHPERRFIYITPYLTEAARIRKGCPELHFVEPSNKLSEYKFKKTLHTAALIEEGRNITTTHAAFKNYTKETLAKIRELGYTLIIDESVEILVESQLKPNDLRMLESVGLLETDGRTYWSTDKPYDGGKFEEEVNMLRSRRIVGIESRGKQKLYYWALPPELITSFDEVFILTYLFSGQSMWCFMKIYDIPYQYIGVSYDDGVYRFSDNIDYIPEYTKHLKDLIHIEESERLNRIGNGEHALSMNWYNQRKMGEDGELQIVKNHIVNFFRYKCPRHKPNERMWGTYKCARNKIKGKGYTKGYVVFNERATNTYIDKKYLAYAVNVFMNVNEKLVYKSFGIEINEDIYALSTMLQWMWRSAIRRGEEIWVYVPSRRMRTLLKDWIEGVQNGDNNEDNNEQDFC